MKKLPRKEIEISYKASEYSGSFVDTFPNPTSNKFGVFGRN